MQFTGHCNVSSLNAYKKPCLQKQRKMSESLCALYIGTCGPASEEAKQPSGDIRTALGGVFSGACWMDAQLTSTCTLVMSTD